MFGKTIVIAVLVTVVKNASLRAVVDESTLLSQGDDSRVTGRKSTEPLKVNWTDRAIVEYLNCSDLHAYSSREDVIEISNTIFVDSNNPCIMKASVIILNNNEFLGYKHAFNITGKRIIMIDNTFIGPEQNHYIVGDNVLLTNNTYQGHLQLHEVAGYEVIAFQNVYDGQYRVNQYSGTHVLAFDNESKGNSFDYIFLKNPVNLMYNLYPNDLSNYETGAFTDIKVQIDYTLGKTGPETFDLTPMNATRFLQDVKFGSKIKRPASATIVKRLEDLIKNNFPGIVDISQITKDSLNQ